MHVYCIPIYILYKPGLLGALVFIVCITITSAIDLLYIYMIYMALFSQFIYKTTIAYCYCCCKITSVVSDSVRPHRWQPTTESPVPVILQARTLEWVAISFSNAWKWKVKVKSLSCIRLLATPWTAAYQAPPSMGFSRQEYWSELPLPSPKWV